LAWRGFSFGHEGHEAVAVLALQKLHDDQAANNPKAMAALEHIRAILGHEDLAAVAVWADWVRLEQTNRLSMSVIHDIKARFPGSDDWHFVDLPLGTTAYSDTAVSANVDDVVHGIGKCISMLESADRSTKKDRHAVALKFLIHLAGDIHQPLHVACGYYRWNFKGIIRSPAPVTIGHLPHDRGGNKLLLAGGSDELHALWDSDLVFIQAGKHSPTAVTNIVNALKGAFTPNLFPAQTGDHHGWAAKWATDSIKVAVLAYKGIKVPRIPVPGPHHSKREIPKTTLTSFDKGSYIAAHQNEEKQQLLKASWRLAEMLENINWHN